MKKILPFIAICCLVSKLTASHIVGGEIMYQYQGKTGNNYDYLFTMNIYFDCWNAQTNVIESDVGGITLHVFDPVSRDVLEPYCRQGILGKNATTISKTNYTCMKNTPDACVVRYTFTQLISFADDPDGYVIAFERCCRNKIITNITEPGATGATYWTRIKSPAMKDNSPIFKSLPPNFLCTNAPLKFDHSAFDPDGDSLVYELFQPYNGGSGLGNGAKPDIFNSNMALPGYPTEDRKVNYENGFDVYNQIEGNPGLSIDRFTGKLSLTPTRTGNFVIGVKVLEYRNGVLIGETKRDFQFNVAECQFDVVSSFFVPKFNCSGTEMTFENRSQGAQKYSWDFGDPGKQSDTSNGKNPKYTYQKGGNYSVRLIAINTLCIDTFEYDITVREKFKVSLPVDTLICGPFTKKLMANVPNKNYKWNTGSNGQAINATKGGQYWVSVTDEACISKDTINIINDLSVLDLGPDSVICRDSFVQFTWEGKPGYKTYLWNDNTKDQTVFISKLGTYWVNVTNQNNCPSMDSITFVLYPPPHVYLNDTLFCKGTSVTLDGVNYSMKTKLETHYLWNTGETTPQIVTFLPGRYNVKVRNRLCTILDTAILTHIETGLDLGNDTFYCGPVDRWLIPKKDYVKYQWNDNSETIDYHVTSPGKKKLTITSKEGCVESDSVFISQYPPIDGGLGNDTAICVSSTMELRAVDSMVGYWWNTGATSRSISIRDAGMYMVTVTNKNGCVVKDSVHVTEQANALPIDLFMPNAFSPNGDELNEVYPGNKYSDPGSAYQLRIYNRWGEKIFEGNKPSQQWDGSVKGHIAEQDVYIFYVKYVGCDDVERWFRGTFTLIR